MALWAITVYNYQIADYYESFFPGDQFQQLMAISAVELVGYILGGLAFESFKVRPCIKLYVVSFAICFVGAIGILFNDEAEYPYLDMLMHFVAKIGIAMAFQAVYLANVLFPIVFSSTTFGICCMMGSTGVSISITTIYDYFDTKYFAWSLYAGLSLLAIFLALLQKEL